jgi:hypothetical protein
MKTIRLLLFIFLLALPTLACGLSRGEATPEPQAEPTAAPANTPASTNTPAPTPTADLAANFVPYEDEFQGLTLSIPADWVAESFFFTLLASDQKMLDAFLSGDSLDAPMNGALMIMLAGDPAEFDSDDLTEMLLESLAEMDILADESEIVEPPSLTTINGQEAATAVAQGLSDNNTPLTVLAVIIRSQEHNRVLVIIGATPTELVDEQMPIMRAVANSAEVGPEGTFPDFTMPRPADDAEFIFLNETIEREVTDFNPATFAFSGSPTVFYDIIVTPLDASLEPMVNLVDEDGFSLLLSGEVGGPFSPPEIRGFQPEDYSLLIITVRGFAESTGAFRLELREGTEAGAAGAIAASTQVGPGSELVMTGAIVDGAYGRYRFMAGIDSAIKATVTPLDGLDVVLEVYNFATDEKLLEVDNSFGVETLTFQPPALDLYALEVSGYNGQEGRYEISLTASPDVLLELFSESTLYGWLDDTEEAEYVLDLRQGDQIVISAEPEEGFDLVLDLLDADDRQLASVDDGNRGELETLIYTISADDVYFVRVRGFAGAAGGRFTMNVSIIR